MSISTSDNEDRSNSDIPVFWDSSFEFNSKTDILTLTNPLRLWMGRHPAGFGMSVACSLELDKGIHSKKEIASTLLRKGYFGETIADLKFEAWHKKYNTMEVSLINKTSAPFQYWELHM